MLLALICVTPAHATGLSTEIAESKTDSDRLAEADLSVEPTYYMPEASFLDSVTMTQLPPGSLVVRYDGPQKILIKHARSQVRRYARRYREYSEEAQPQIDIWNDTVDLNAWWTRSWMDSLPSEKGGAPDQPYVHTIGTEITWRLGPLTVSNMLKVKLDYVAVLKFNPDPGERTSDRDPLPASLDVNPPRSALFGSRLRVKVKPIIRIGMPKDSWLSTIRSLAIQANLDIVIFGVHFLRGEILLKYKPGDDIGEMGELTLSFGFSLVNW